MVVHRLRRGGRENIRRFDDKIKEWLLPIVWVPKQMKRVETSSGVQYFLESLAVFEEANANLFIAVQHERCLEASHHRGPRDPPMRVL